MLSSLFLQLRFVALHGKVGPARSRIFQHPSGCLVGEGQVKRAPWLSVLPRRQKPVLRRNVIVGGGSRRGLTNARRADVRQKACCSYRAPDNVVPVTLLHGRISVCADRKTAPDEHVVGEALEKTEP